MSFFSLTPPPRSAKLTDTARVLPATTMSARFMPFLTAAQLAENGLSERQVRRQMAAWREHGGPTCVRVPRVGADGEPVGGVQWAVDADEYAALARGEFKPLPGKNG